VLRASVGASWRSCAGVGPSDVPTLAKYIQLGLLVSLLTLCSRTACLVDIAWLGSFADQSAMPVAEVHTPCICTYIVTLVLLALHGDTRVS